MQLSGTLLHYWWELITVQPLWKISLAIPQKVKHRNTINSILRYMPKRIPKTDIQVNACT